jgi:uncharacterized protein YggU (UPF0235/DUF167 family)
VRVEILVRPRAAKSGVGGSHGGALVVAVAEPAVDGRATRAALRAVAQALGVPPRSVTLAGGATSRRKLVEVDCTGADEEEVILRRLGRLREDDGRTPRGRP